MITTIPTTKEEIVRQYVWCRIDHTRAVELLQKIGFEPKEAENILFDVPVRVNE